MRILLKHAEATIIAFGGFRGYGDGQVTGVIPVGVDKGFNTCHVVLPHRTRNVFFWSAFFTLRSIVVAENKNKKTDTDEGRTTCQI